MWDLSLISIQLEFLEDTQEYYIATESIPGAHAVGKTPQEAINNFLDIIPELIALQEKAGNHVLSTKFSGKLSMNLPVSFSHG